MNIEKYTSYFHDGIIHEIHHLQDKIILLLESAEILPEWNKENIALSKRNTISGNLHLEKLENIYINDKKFEDTLVKSYDSSDIYSFDIKFNKVIFVVSWINYPPKPREETPFFEYIFETKKIIWENIPSGSDKYWQK